MPVQLCRSRDADAYRVLYDIEAYLRLLVRWELRGAAGRSWRGQIEASMVSSAKDRLRQEKDDGLVDPLQSGLLSYLNLSELKDIVLGVLWTRCLADSWSAQDVVRSEFKKLIAVRNKVAHFRPVTEWDARVVARFAEDLTRWTRPYRRLREVELVWDYGTAIGGSFAVKAEKHSLMPLLQDVMARIPHPLGDSVSLAFVGHHVALRSKRLGGAFAPKRVLEILEGLEPDITLARVGEFGGFIELLVPLQCGGSAIIGVLERLIDVANLPPHTTLSSDAMIGAYGLDSREGVLADATSFPDAFFG